MDRLIFIAYTGFVAFVSLRPMNDIAVGDWDKVGHLVVYFIFALLGYRVVSKLEHYFYLCIGIVVYSGLMEVAQSFLPGRMMSGYDLLANAVGVAIAMIFARALFSDRNK